MDEYELRKNQRKKNFSNKAANMRQNTSNSGLVEVYQDTIRVCNSMKIPLRKSIKYSIMELKVPLPENPVFRESVTVQCIDTLDMAQDFVQSKLNPLVLNMASDYKPGGGVISGKTAQEECIFRRSNAFMTHYSEWYPLEWKEVIYSPAVTVIKDSNYQLITPFQIGMIAVAGIRKPRLYQGDYLDEDRKLMQEKIESIFKIAILHGHDSLVLGALGCGVFCNPPIAVAQIFASNLAIYSRYFKKIGFAILGNHNDMTNYETFLKFFERS
jgi:uncharacterized protein (TIGR02452 family)